MHEQSGGRRQVDLFNFSFLDILACVIGLLIFILTIVVVSGGGSKTAQAAQSVATAERQVREQRFAAKLASERRSRLEGLLNQRATEAVDPAGAARAVQGEIELLRNESTAIQAARARALQNLDSLRQDLDRTERATGANPAVIAAQAETQQVNQQTAKLQAQAGQIRQQKVKSETVSYYIPHFAETARFPVWLEVARDRLYVVESASYRQVPLQDGGTLYRLLPGAAGIPIRDGRNLKPDDFSYRDPSTVVLSIVVRPDGYGAFRKLREQAWALGYAVNWIPSDATEPIVLFPSHKAFAQ